MRRHGCRGERGENTFLIFYYQHTKSEISGGHTDKAIKLLVCYRHMVFFKSYTLEYLIPRFVEFLIEMLK